jgi:hypothetical protein
LRGLLGLARAPDERHEPPRQRRAQLETTPELGRHEGMKGAHESPPRQQVHAFPLELARAGAGEDEPETAAPLDQIVDHVQEDGRLLHLVDHHHAPVRIAGDQLPQPFRPCGVLPVDLGPQQVNPQRVRILLPEPGRFPRSARSEEEEMSGRSLEESRDRRQIRCVFGGSHARL